MNLIECKTLKDLPDDPLKVFPVYIRDLDESINAFRKMYNQETGSVYHIFGEYRFEIPEERKR